MKSRFFLFPTFLILGMAFVVGVSVQNFDVINRQVSDSGLMTEIFDFGRQTNYSGYIVEFSGSPVIVRRAELEAKAELNSQSILNKIPGVNVLYKIVAVTPDSVSSRVENYAWDLNKSDDKIKKEILDKLFGNSFSLTGNVISSENSLQIIAEYRDVFNGIVLNITSVQAEAIKGISGVQAVYPNYKVHTFLDTSVPLIQNGIPAGNLNSDGKDCTRNFGECLTGKGIKIAIIDSGVDYSHPDLGRCGGKDFAMGRCTKVIGGYDFYNDDSDPMDDNGHGTHVAATAAGNGDWNHDGILQSDEGLNGVAPGAQILAYKALGSDGLGDSSMIISAIEQAVKDGADIISMSLGGEGTPDDPLSQASDNAITTGVTVVVAAGNSGPSEQTIGSPGDARDVITVGAIYKQDYSGTYFGDFNPMKDQVTSFSSRGPVGWKDTDGNLQRIMKPDIVAPGAMICAAQLPGFEPWNENALYSQCKDDKHVLLAGTSMATPHVAGVVALIKQAHSDWTPEEIKSDLKTMADNLVDPLTGNPYDPNVQGVGNVDLNKAVSLDFPCVAELGLLGEVNNNFYVLGSAYCKNNLKSFFLYYKSSEKDSDWIEMGRFFSNIIDGNLMGFDANLLDEGMYLIKLVVTDAKDREYSDEGSFIVNNFEIKSVGDNIGYLGKGNAKIIGDIKFSSYNAYKIEYSPKGTDDWENLCYSNKKLLGDVLCSTNVDSLDEGEYSLKLFVLKESKWFQDSDEFKIAVIHELMNGWPLEFPGIQSTPLFFSDFGSEDSKLVQSSYNDYGLGFFGPGVGGSSIHLISSDASYEQINSLSFSERILDIKPAGILSTLNQYLVISNFQGGMGIFDSTGKFLLGWPQGHDLRGYPMVVGDKIFSLSDLKLYGFDDKGNTLTDFPVDISKIDPDDDLQLSQLILIKSNNEFRLGILGSELSHFDDKTGYFSRELFFDIYSEQGQFLKRTILSDNSHQKVEYFLTVAAADLDGDGNSEIAVGFMVQDMDAYHKDKYNLEAYKSYLKILDSEGNLISEPFGIDGYIIRNIRIGNFGRQTSDVVFELEHTFPTMSKGQEILAMDYTGNLLFRLIQSDPNKVLEGMSIGDIDDDGHKEVVVFSRSNDFDGRPSEILIYNDQGILEKDILIPTFGAIEFGGVGGDPILADFNQDGKTDVAQQTLFIPENPFDFTAIWKSHIFVFNLNSPYNPDAMDWPQFQHDAQHTGCYDCDKVSSAPESGIVNNGNSDIKGTLVMNIEEYNRGKWDVYKNVISQEIVISSYSSFDLGSIWNSKHVSVSTGGGVYRVRTFLLDDFGNVIETKNGKLETTRQFVVNSGLPIK
ncbi:MAG: S8 family serine peptidase [Nanoarchaeota archaeon]|nr:S8 family serine peptidase [Nanoarchaeota archaeon]